MPKYKVLKAVAHNVGHSFLSDMNAVGTASRYTIVPQHLYEVALRSGIATFVLDIVSQEIRPSEFRTPVLQESAGHYRRMLWEQVTSQGAAPEMVKTAELQIRFDLDASRASQYMKDVQSPVFTCEVRLQDDRGIEHLARPVHWWRG